MDVGAKPRTFWSRVKEHPLARHGAGLITGAADDDPSGIGTYSQAGAKYGLDMLWTIPLAFPLIAAIQSMCGRIGRVTGKGLAANIKAEFPPVVLKGVVALLLAANTLNIAADVDAMGEVAGLVTHLNRHLMTAFFVCLTLLLQLLVPYHRYVRFLKWLTLSLLAYVAVLFFVHVPWNQVAIHTFLPHVKFDSGAASMVLGILGTTISPYLFFWQTSEEVEDMRAPPRAESLLEAPAVAEKELRRIRWDTWSGMFYSDITAYIIILATAVTLHAAGIKDIDTAAKAAGALRPVAGEYAYLLFAIGIIGTGLLGVPVLAASGAYALCETMGWKCSLEHKPSQARGFYTVIAVSVLAGLVIQYTPIPPMKALFWAAVINGLVAVPLMAVVIILATRRSVMGKFTAARWVAVIGWIATVLMAAAAIWMFMP
ncbi:MAG TPA: divalent metal cation transporter [Gammaproteobacteria bacterium]|nr:divalent metal cation transporter [Gammaproteobacteria bacterium]